MLDPEVGITGYVVFPGLKCYLTEQLNISSVRAPPRSGFFSSALTSVRLTKTPGTHDN